MAEVEQILAEITRDYIEQGYITTRAYLPSQDRSRGRSVAVEAGPVDMRAAKNTSQSSESSIDGQVKLSAGVNAGTDGVVNGALSGSFDKKSRDSAASGALVAGITAGDNLSIRTEDDAGAASKGGEARDAYEMRIKSSVCAASC